MVNASSLWMVLMPRERSFGGRTELVLVSRQLASQHVKEVSTIAVEGLPTFPFGIIIPRQHQKTLRMS